MKVWHYDNIMAVLSWLKDWSSFLLMISIFYWYNNGSKHFDTDLVTRMPSECKPPEYKPPKTCLKTFIWPGFIFEIFCYEDLSL